jgi:hypothetical protein
MHYFSGWCIISRYGCSVKHNSSGRCIVGSHSCLFKHHSAVINSLTCAYYLSSFTNLIWQHINFISAVFLQTNVCVCRPIKNHLDFRLSKYTLFNAILTSCYNYGMPVRWGLPFELLRFGTNVWHKGPSARSILTQKNADRPSPEQNLKPRFHCWSDTTSYTVRPGACVNGIGTNMTFLSLKQTGRAGVDVHYVYVSCTFDTSGSRMYVVQGINNTR